MGYFFIFFSTIAFSRIWPSSDVRTQLLKIYELYDLDILVTERQRIWRGCGLWIKNFTVQNCVRKIFISRQHKKIPKIAKCQENRVIDSFLYMKKTSYVFSLEPLLIWWYVPKNTYFWPKNGKNIYIYFL